LENDQIISINTYTTSALSATILKQSKEKSMNTEQINNEDEWLFLAGKDVINDQKFQFTCMDIDSQIEGLQKIIGTLHESVSDNCPYLHESINETKNMFGNIRLDINKMMSQHHYESEVYVVDA
jgi:archaellum component FlaC